MGKDQISIRIPPGLLQEIDDLAKREIRNRNNMIEVLLKEALAARQKPADK